MQSSSVIAFFVSILVFNAYAYDEALEQKPMVVVIPSYNNAAWCKQNIESVLHQNYENFRVIYIDDCSTDQTGSLILELVAAKQQQQRVHFVRNTQRRGALANIYSAIHTCDDDEIVIMLDGDDWLAHNDVLARVNREYRNNHVWLTYGQFKAYPDGRIGECKEYNKGVLQHNCLREWDWVASHLRTFYAGLFKKISLKDLVYQGNFFDVTWDMALMFPMLEMAGGKISFIPDVLYIYNCATASNDFKTKLLKQIHCDKVVRSRSKYTSLSQISFEKNNNKKLTASIVLVTDSSSNSLIDTVKTVENYVLNITDITVLHGGDQNLRDDQQSCMHSTYKKYTTNTFKKELLDTLKECQSDFILIGSDGYLINDYIDCSECIAALQQTKAYAFHMHLGAGVEQCPFLDRACVVPPLLTLNNSLYAWTYAQGEQDWREYNSLKCVLYNKQTITKIINDIRFTSLHELKTGLHHGYNEVDAMGLCFKNAKAHKV